jgi:cytochrome P450
MALLEINAALLSTIFIGILFVLTYWSSWRRYFELGMKLPGPPALPIVGNCLQFTTNDFCKLFQEYKETLRSYSPVARLRFGPVLMVVLSDPESIESLVKQDKFWGRGYLVKKLGGTVFRNGLLWIDGDQWLRHRKIISAYLRMNILETFVENFAKNSDILANKLKVLADGVTAHDILPFLKRCTLDGIVQTSYKMEINPLTGHVDSSLKNLTTIIDITVVRFLKAWLYIEWIFKATELGKKYYKAVQCEYDKMNNHITRIKRMRETSENRGENENKPKLIDLLIQHGDINHEEIIGEISTIIGAGTDTISTACGYVLALLGENQHIQASVIQEQQDIFGDDILRPVRSDDLPRMVYLEQVGN